MLRIRQTSNIKIFSGEQKYPANLSPNQLFLKSKFFRLAGNVIQQKKKVSPYDVYVDISF